MEMKDKMKTAVEACNLFCNCIEELTDGLEDNVADAFKYASVSNVFFALSSDLKDSTPTEFLTHLAIEVFKGEYHE